MDVVRCRKNGLANATFPLPVFSPLDSVECSRDGHLAELTYVELHRDDRQALLRKLPYLGRGLVQQARGRVPAGNGPADFSSPALEAMEDAWPEGEEHMAKLSVIGLWAGNQDLV